MSPIQSAIFSTLGQNAGVSAVAGARIYPDIAPPQTTRPFIVWQEVSLAKQNDMSGSVETGGLDNYRVQVTCYAERGTASRELDILVRSAMQGASAFKSLHVDARSLPFEIDTKLFGMQSDFSVWLRT